jgi:hypothetical protein
MTIEEIKTILEEMNFPERFSSDQTAICVKALLDKTDRSGLLPGHKNLSEGARVHDILNFAREVVGKKVAENTREAYRKNSLAPLMNYGLIVRHQLSTNDPNTYYRLHPDFIQIFSEQNVDKRNKLISGLQKLFAKAKAIKKSQHKHDMSVRIDAAQVFSLSPGEHNSLERAVVEIFGHAFLHDPQVVYLGDTAPRKGYQNRTLMRKLNLPIDTTASLPDIILFSEPESHVVIVEAVSTSGPVNSLRLDQLKKFTKGPRKLRYKISYISAFPSRSIFRRFVEQISWGSSVWIENEPHNIVHFEETVKEK